MESRFPNDWGPKTRLPGAYWCHFLTPAVTLLRRCNPRISSHGQLRIQCSQIGHRRQFGQHGLPHVLQTCVFYPECVHLCTVRLPDSANALAHVSHTCGVSPEFVRMCQGAGGARGWRGWGGRAARGCQLRPGRLIFGLGGGGRRRDGLGAADKK